MDAVKVGRVSITTTADKDQSNNWRVTEVDGDTIYETVFLAPRAQARALAYSYEQECHWKARDELLNMSRDEYHEWWLYNAKAPFEKATPRHNDSQNGNE